MYTIDCKSPVDDEIMDADSLVRKEEQNVEEDFGR